MSYFNESGKCPYCGEYELDYDSAEFIDDLIKYPYTCSHCGHAGEEFYKLNFAGHNITDDDGNEIILDSNED